MSSLDSNDSIRQMTNSFLCKPIGRAMTNPLTLAVMLTTIIMMIVVCSYDRDHIFRTIFRIFSVSTIFLFINNHILMDDMSCSRLTADQNNILNIVEKGVDNSSAQSLVVPKYTVDPIINDD
jgi:hypothetical protein